MCLSARGCSIVYSVRDVLVPCEQGLHVSTSLSYFFMLHVGVLYIAVVSDARGAAVFQTLSDSLRALAAFSLTVAACINRKSRLKINGHSGGQNMAYLCVVNCIHYSKQSSAIAMYLNQIL